MPRIRTFCWKRKDSPRILGYLTYDEDTREFTVEASQEGDSFSLTPQLYALIMKGTPKIRGQKALKWIRSRIEPPERPEMPDILKAAGLKRYDEFGLLMFHRGRSVRDKMYLEEITDSIKKKH